MISADSSTARIKRLHAHSYRKKENDEKRMYMVINRLFEFNHVAVKKIYSVYICVCSLYFVDRKTNAGKFHIGMCESVSDMSIW